MDVREGPAVFRASKTLGLISGSLISLALDPAAGMKLDAAPSFRPKAVGVWQREGSGLAYGPVGGNTIRNRTGGLIKASVLSGTYHVPDIACKHMTIPTATPRNRLLSCCIQKRRLKLGLAQGHTSGGWERQGSKAGSQAPEPVLTPAWLCVGWELSLGCLGVAGGERRGWEAAQTASCSWTHPGKQSGEKGWWS